MFAIKLDKKSAPTPGYSPSPSAFHGSQRKKHLLDGKKWKIEK
jgi:hypothetical protein